MFYCTNKTPNEFYHYTLKSNVNSIIEKMLLKSGDDGYLWGCLSLEDIIKQFYNTILNPDYIRIDNTGMIETIPSTNKDDYIILKVVPKYDCPQNWFKYDIGLPLNTPKSRKQKIIYNPYELSIAYQGNLRIKIIDTLQIP